MYVPYLTLSSLFNYQFGQELAVCAVSEGGRDLPLGACQLHGTAKVIIMVVAVNVTCFLADQVLSINAEQGGSVEPPLSTML